MDVGMEAGIFLAYAAGIALIFFFGKMLVIPARFMLKLLLNGAAGGALLVILNFFGGAIGITVPVNLITAFCGRSFGSPGNSGSRGIFLFLVNIEMKYPDQEIS